MRRGKQKHDNTVEMMAKLDEIRDSTIRLHAAFEAHLKQDEQFYLEVKGVASGQSQIAEKLGEYNSQLAVHIAGVQELRKHTAIMEENQRKFVEESNTRLAKIEKPYVWAELTNNIVVFMAKAITIAAAAYGVIKFLAGLGLF